jgi:quercetin dioxygenase-like cupin family protein
VVEGKGRVFFNDEWHDIKPGDVVFVPPNEQHQYINAGDTTFKFLCGIPVKKYLPQG